MGRARDLGRWPRGIHALPMASSEPSRRVERVVGHSPLCDMDAFQRSKFHEATRRRRLRGSTRQVAGGGSQGRAEPAELRVAASD
jgi:hypothetical protein